MGPNPFSPDRGSVSSKISMFEQNLSPQKLPSSQPKQPPTPGGTVSKSYGPPSPGGSLVKNAPASPIRSNNVATSPKQRPIPGGSATGSPKESHSGFNPIKHTNTYSPGSTSPMRKDQNQEDRSMPSSPPNPKRFVFSKEPTGVKPTQINITSQSEISNNDEDDNVEQPTNEPTSSINQKQNNPLRNNPLFLKRMAEVAAAEAAEDEDDFEYNFEKKVKEQGQNKDLTVEKKKTSPDAKEKLMSQSPLFSKRVARVEEAATVSESMGEANKTKKLNATSGESNPNSSLNSSPSKTNVSTPSPKKSVVESPTAKYTPPFSAKKSLLRQIRDAAVDDESDCSNEDDEKQNTLTTRTMADRKALLASMRGNASGGKPSESESLQKSPSSKPSNANMLIESTKKSPKSEVNSSQFVKDVNETSVQLSQSKGIEPIESTSSSESTSSGLRASLYAKRMALQSKKSAEALDDDNSEEVETKGKSIKSNALVNRASKLSEYWHVVQHNSSDETSTQSCESETESNKRITQENNMEGSSKNDSQFNPKNVPPKVPTSKDVVTKSSPVVSNKQHVFNAPKPSNDNSSNSSIGASIHSPNGDSESRRRKKLELLRNKTSSPLRPSITNDHHQSKITEVKLDETKSKITEVKLDETRSKITDVKMDETENDKTSSVNEIDNASRRKSKLEMLRKRTSSPLKFHSSPNSNPLPQVSKGEAPTTKNPIRPKEHIPPQPPAVNASSTPSESTPSRREKIEKMRGTKLKRYFDKNNAARDESSSASVISKDDMNGTKLSFASIASKDDKDATKSNASEAASTRTRSDRSVPVFVRNKEIVENARNTSKSPSISRTESEGSEHLSVQKGLEVIARSQLLAVTNPKSPKMLVSHPKSPVSLKNEVINSSKSNMNTFNDRNEMLLPPTKLSSALARLQKIQNLHQQQEDDNINADYGEFSLEGERNKSLWAAEMEDRLQTQIRNFSFEDDYEGSDWNDDEMKSEMKHQQSGSNPGLNYNTGLNYNHSFVGPYKVLLPRTVNSSLVRISLSTPSSSLFMASQQQQQPQPSIVSNPSSSSLGFQGQDQLMSRSAQQNSSNSITIHTSGQQLSPSHINSNNAQIYHQNQLVTNFFGSSSNPTMHTQPLDTHQLSSTSSQNAKFFGSPSNPSVHTQPFDTHQLGSPSSQNVITTNYSNDKEDSEASDRSDDDEDIDENTAFTSHLEASTLLGQNHIDSDDEHSDISNPSESIVDWKGKNNNGNNQEASAFVDKVLNGDKLSDDSFSSNDSDDDVFFGLEEDQRQTKEKKNSKAVHHRESKDKKLAAKKVEKTSTTKKDPELSAILSGGSEENSYLSSPDEKVLFKDQSNTLKKHHDRRKETQNKSRRASDADSVDSFKLAKKGYSKSSAMSFDSQQMLSTVLFDQFQKARSLLDTYACGITEPMSSGQFRRKLIVDQKSNDKRKKDNHYESGHDDDDDRTRASMLSSQMDLSAQERRLWDTWDEKDRIEDIDSQSHQSYSYVSDGPVSYATDELRAIHEENRARAHEKLLMHAYDALAMPKVLERGPNEEEDDYRDPRETSTKRNQNQQSLHKPQSRSQTYVSDEENNANMNNLSHPSIMVTSNANNRQVSAQKSLDQFSHLMKKYGMEVLKLNRENKWQERWLTISKEGSWIGNNNGEDPCFCPLGILWVKKFNPKNNYSVTSIGKHGKGGILIAYLYDVNEAENPEISHGMSKKLQQKYARSTVIKLYPKDADPVRHMTLMCQKDDARMLISGCRAMISVLNGKLSETSTNQHNGLSYRSSTPSYHHDAPLQQQQYYGHEYQQGHYGDAMDVMHNNNGGMMYGGPASGQMMQYDAPIIYDNMAPGVYYDVNSNSMMQHHASYAYNDTPVWEA